jgi:hypothetical protein
VVEELAGRREEVEPERALERGAEKQVEDRGCKRRVGQDLDRVLIEGGDCLDAGRRVMDLVEDVPEAIEMADAVPPIEEEEGPDQPADEALQHGRVPGRELD